MKLQKCRQITKKIVRESTVGDALQIAHVVQCNTVTNDLDPAVLCHGEASEGIHHICFNSLGLQMTIDLHYNIQY